MTTHTESSNIGVFSIYKGVGIDYLALTLHKLID